MRKFFSFSGKILKNLFPAILGPFFVYLDKNAKKKKAQSVFKYYNYLPSCKKSERTNEPFLRKMLNCQTDRQTDRQTNSDFIGPSVGQGSN